VHRFSFAVLISFAVLFLAVPSRVTTNGRQTTSQPTAVQAGNKANVLVTYGRLPLSFERNQGQSDPRVEFLSRGRGYTLFLTQDEAVLAMRNTATSSELPISSYPMSSSLLHMTLVGANASATAVGDDELPGKSNYFIGSDRGKWTPNVANYAKVRYAGIYPGIDLVYYGTQGQLEYDFVVRPGVDASAIRVGINDSEHQNLQLDLGGALVVNTQAGDLRFRKPVIYQRNHDGSRQVVDGNYKLLTANTIGFEVGAYDRSRELVIDPVVSYSSFLGGGGDDAHDSVSVAVDSAGNAYIASGTTSSNFPVSVGAAQAFFAGGPAICDQGGGFCGDAFVTKINAAGTAIVYSTYLGGNDADYAFGLAVDSTGSAYVAGLTKSVNFPVTAGVFQPSFGGYPSPCDDWVCGDAFITKLNANGSALSYSSYLGGSGNEHPEGLVVDAQGNAYLAGDTGSANFPTTPGAFQTQLRGTDTCGGRSSTVVCHNAFVTKVNPTGTKLVYSTYLGGSSNDYSGGIAVDSAGHAVAVGGACSSDFPVTAGAFQKTNAGGCDIFVSVFSPTGGQLLYSTLFGGTGYDATFGGAVDASGNVYIGGLTSSPDLPVTGGSVQTIYGGNVDAVVAKFNPRAAGAASLMYSTYLGGSQNDTAADVAVDSLGNAYVCGQTYSSDFPAVNAVQAAKHGTSDAFLVELNPQGSALLFSTYLGGSGDQLADNVTLDRAGNAYVVGWTRSGDFPTTPRAFQPGFAGGATDLFVVKVNPSNAAGVSITPAALNFAPQAVGTTSASQTVIVHNFGSAALTISKVATAGDFAQTNDCHGSVAGGGSCAVSIIFAATSSGSRTGTLSLTDNAGGSPQKIVLTGTGK